MDNDNARIRNLLKSMIFVPTLLGQISGYIIFKIDKHNRLKVSIPLIFLAILNFGLQIYCFTAYFILSKSCGYFFGEYNPSDRFVNILQVLALASAAFGFRFWLIKKYSLFVNFHENLSTVTCDLMERSTNGIQLCYSEQFNNFEIYSKRMTSVKSSLRKTLYVSAAFLGINLCFIFGAFVHLVLIFKEVPPKALIMFLGLILIIFVQGVAYPSLYIWFNCYINWLGMGFYSLAKESFELLSISKSSLDLKTNYNDDILIQVRKLLYHEEFLETLVEQFNNIFGIPILVWIISLTTVILHQAYVVLRWIHVGFFIGAISTLAVMFLYPFAIFTLCNTAFKFTQETQKNLDQLCKNFLLNDVVNSNRVLQTKIMMLYQKRQARVITISPAYFFTLNRQTLTRICSVIITYLVVLMQFRNTDDEMNFTNETETSCEDLIGKNITKRLSGFGPPAKLSN